MFFFFCTKCLHYNGVNSYIFVHGVFNEIFSLQYEKNWTIWMFL